ncbi:MAG TPA: tetratricopeptide repeat protein [Polyangia bacterium]|nr:tetratricopeptide repeat protein [Polyangia bacterium]
MTSATRAHAEAEDSAAVEKVTKLNKKAVDEYQNLNFEEARKLLRAAVDTCSQAGLDNHPVTARTYVHLGIVTFAGFKQRDEAIKYFRKALDIQADIKLDKILATPEVQEVYDEAVAQQKEAAAAAVKKEPPKPGEGIEHEPVTESPQGSPITIKATIDPALGAKKVVLSFSADGADDFAEKEMQEDPPGSGKYSAEIPQSATQGGVVDYFIEALGDNDSPIATKGSSTKTLKISMLGPNGQPLVPRKPKKPPEKKPTSEEAPSLFFGLGVGSGFGWTTGTGEINATKNKVNPPGFEMSRLLHFAPEVGYYVSPDLLVSVQLRLQLVSGATDYHSDPNDPNDRGCGSDNVCKAGTYAFAGLARASLFFGEGDFRTYVAGNLGVGTIRHVATFESNPVCGTNRMTTCVDTVPAGPILVGAGAGIMYNVSPAFALTLGTNALVAFTKFTFHVDLNAGLAFEY